jgi:hypothetical protein
MSLEEYWTGKGTEVENIWADFDEGQAYIEKFQSRPVHLITLVFKNDRISSPLYNHEAIFKTVKACFHELKYLSLSDSEYDDSLPLFLYDVERGSSKYSFVGELAQVVMFGTTLTEQQIMNLQLENFQKRMQILERFGVNPIAHIRQLQNLQSATNTRTLQSAINHILSNGLQEVLISEQPILGNPEQARASLRSVGRIDFKV